MKRLAKLIDDVRFLVWRRFQNGNQTLQAMSGDLAIIEDQLVAARSAAHTGDSADAEELIDQALQTVHEHQNTLREIL